MGPEREEGNNQHRPERKSTVKTIPPMVIPSRSARHGVILTCADFADNLRGELRASSYADPMAEFTYVDMLPPVTPDLPGL